MSLIPVLCAVSLEKHAFRRPLIFKKWSGNIYAASKPVFRSFEYSKLSIRQIFRIICEQYWMCSHFDECVGSKIDECVRSKNDECVLPAWWMCTVFWWMFPDLVMNVHCQYVMNVYELVSKFECVTIHEKYDIFSFHPLDLLTIENNFCFANV